MGPKSVRLWEASIGGSLLEFVPKHIRCQLSFRRRQHGRVVRAPDLKSGGPGFKSRSDHYLNLFSVVPSSNPRSCLLPVGIFSHVMFNICFIYTTPQASSFKHKPCINKVALPLPFFFLRNPGNYTVQLIEFLKF